MLKKLLLTTVSVAAISGASLASAATFNFIDLIDNQGVGEGTWDFKADTAPISGGVWTVGGIGVSASATSVSSPGNAKAYLDAGGAGLGVCSTVNASSQCGTSSDDNTGIAGDPTSGTNYETLILSFTTAVTLDSLLFMDREHKIHTDDFSLKINGILWSPGGSFAGIGPASTYSFERIFGSDKNTRDFYLGTAAVTAVPLPAAAWLFGSALIGLAGIARKRKLS